MRKPPPIPSASGWPSIALCLLLAACSGSMTPSGPRPTGPLAATTAAPASSGDGSASTPSPQDLPLPEPRLRTIDEIIAAMDYPEQSEQVAVSLLALLGVGLYTADGTPIRKGTEASDDDFYLFEPEARGLAAMLRDRADLEQHVTFRDLHAAVVEGGYIGTAEELARAFSDAYAANPDADVSRLIAALGAVAVDTTLSEFELCLLILDGFIPPNRATSAMAMAGDAAPLVAAGGSGWGVAGSNLKGTQPGPWYGTLFHLQAVLRALHMNVDPSPGIVHEGHGGLGDSTTVTAQLSGYAPALISPFTGITVLPAPAGAQGIVIAWDADPILSQHGDLARTEGLVEANSEASTTYTAQQEAADGKGLERKEAGRIGAGVIRSDLLVALYGEFAVPFAPYVTGITSGHAHLDVTWHQKAEAVIKIVWTDFYNGVEDRIVFLGDLTDVVGDPANGGMYTGTGTATGSRPGWVGCNPGIDEVPTGTVAATFNGIISGPGKITISAYADPFSSLGGISTAPIEVPLDGSQRGIFTSNVVGELCPHSSDGELTITLLALP